MTVGTLDHVAAGGCEVEVRTLGSGERVLCLHGLDGVLYSDEFLERLGERATVLAPVLPGWREAGRAPHVNTVEDLSFVVLDLLDRYRDGDEPVHLLGCSFGAWVAAEAATRSPGSVASLSLVSPLGLKTGGRLDRAYVDIYATPAEDVRSAWYGDAGNVPDMSALDQDGFRTLAMAQEAVARFGWEPYLHNPKLIHRLRRLDMGCLVVGGSEDRFVLEPGYLRAWADAIGPNAVVEELDGVGHRVEEEAPDRLVEVVARFLAGVGRGRTSGAGTSTGAAASGGA